MLVTRKQQYAAGAKAGAPVIFGFLPVAIAFAIAAAQAGLPATETIGMSAFVFAGASQMMAVSMLLQGAGAGTIIFATFILNLRHLMMSTCIFHRMKDGPLPARLLVAFGITDESFALFMTQQQHSSIWFFFGLISVTWSSWVGGTAIGAAVSGLLPPLLAASLGIALYAMFVVLLVPHVQHDLKLGLLAVATGLCNLLLSQLIAPSWALIVSTLVCAAIGAFWLGAGPTEEDPT